MNIAFLSCINLPISPNAINTNLLFYNPMASFYPGVVQKIIFFKPCVLIFNRYVLIKRSLSIVTDF
jgi:hypothetical protein